MGDTNAPRKNALQFKETTENIKKNYIKKGRYEN